MNNTKTQGLPPHPHSDEEAALLVLMVYPTNKTNTGVLLLLQLITMMYTIMALENIDVLGSQQVKPQNQNM